MMDFNAETLIAASLEHGLNSEPDHEAGDLQQYIRSCWEMLTHGQRRAFYTSAEVSSVIQTSTGKPRFKVKESHFKEDGIEHLLGLAQEHGNDEGADVEIRDLQDSLRAAWSLLDTTQKSDFFSLEEVQETYENAMCHPLEEDFQSNPFQRG